MKGVHCVEWQTKRIEPTINDQTLTSCNSLCNNDSECVEFAFGREENLGLNRCDLYFKTDCSFNT